GRRRAADEVLADGIGFQSAVQPLAPPLVAVAVAQERAVFEGRGVGQRVPLQKCRRARRIYPIACSAGKVSISQVLSCVKKPNRNARPVSTSKPPIAFST